MKQIKLAFVLLTIITDTFNIIGNYSGQYSPPSARPTTPVYFDASAEV